MGDLPEAAEAPRPTLQVIIGSTRPGRLGLPVALWFAERARECGLFDVEVIDLLEINLPLLDEPHHPRLGRYTHAHTKSWSSIVTRGDAYVFVTPEYNYGFNAATKNAIDYLHAEWQRKPVGFVSYGGIAGGTRAVQMLKQVVTTLNMVPIFESVNIAYVTEWIDENGRFVPSELAAKAADAMVQALRPWTEATRGLREGRPPT